ncbi:MAG: hypothetical protein KIS79_15235 [Burkholderiales bacterium]|nr:hypothetical protein [Burkholderiales bacterium]
MLTVALFVPALIPEHSGARVALAAFAPLYRWLCRARRQARPAANFDAALAGCFGLEGHAELPHAALSLLGEGMDPGQTCWLHADPVHLHAQRAELILVDPVRLQIESAESMALIAALNAYFVQEGLLFHAASPARWYVRLPQSAALLTTALSDAVGRSIDALLPRGADALSWHRCINEAQMLLHQHVVNLEREERGAPAINSLWFWGGGALPACHTATDMLWSDEAFARGLGGCAGIVCEALPRDAGAWLHAAPTGRHLIVLERPEADGADAQWHNRTEQLVRNWVVPLLDALRHGRLHAATLSTQLAGQRVDYVLLPGDRWKLWRRNPGLPDRGETAGDRRHA